MAKIANGVDFKRAVDSLSIDAKEEIHMSVGTHSIGSNIQRLRKAQNPRMPVKRLADLSGLTDSIVRRIEDGTRNPSEAEFTRLCAALRVEPGEVLSSIADDLEARLRLDYWDRLVTVCGRNGVAELVTPAENLDASQRDSELVWLEYAGLLSSAQHSLVRKATIAERNYWLRDAAESIRPNGINHISGDTTPERIAYLAAYPIYIGEQNEKQRNSAPLG